MLKAAISRCLRPQTYVTIFPLLPEVFVNGHDKIGINGHEK